MRHLLIFLLIVTQISCNEERSDIYTTSDSSLSQQVDLRDYTYPIEKLATGKVFCYQLVGKKDASVFELRKLFSNENGQFIQTILYDGFFKETGRVVDKLENDVLKTIHLEITGPDKTTTEFILDATVPWIQQLNKDSSYKVAAQSKDESIFFSMTGYYTKQVDDALIVPHRAEECINLITGINIRFKVERNGEIKYEEKKNKPTVTYFNKGVGKIYYTTENDEQYRLDEIISEDRFFERVDSLRNRFKGYRQKIDKIRELLDDVIPEK